MSLKAVTPDTSPPVGALLARSNRLGADPRNTNYAGGNTSAKGTGIDPVTGTPVELLWVKGSGGDLGTLTEGGSRRPPARPPARARRRLCRRRPRGRDGRRVRLLPPWPRRRRPVDRHRDARAGRGRPRRPPPPRFGDRVRDLGRRRRAHPPLLRRSGRLGRTGAAPASSSVSTSRRSAARTRMPSAPSSADTGSPPGATRRTNARLARSRSSARAERFIVDHGRPDPFGAPIAGLRGHCPTSNDASARRTCCPLIRGLASTDRPQVGHYTDSEVVLDFLARAEHPRLAALGTSCPDHFLRTKVRPLVVDLPPTAPLSDLVARLREAHAAYRADYAAYYAAPRDARQSADPRRRPGDRAGSRDRHVLVRRRQADGARRRRVLRQRHQRHAWRGVPVDVRADPRIGEVQDRVLGARGGQAQAPAEAEAAGGPGRLRHRCGLRHRQGDRPAPGRRGCLRGRGRHRCGERRGRRPRDRRHRRRRSA